LKKSIFWTNEMSRNEENSPKTYTEAGAFEAGAFSKL
jgi:hypothetical protein